MRSADELWVPALALSKVTGRKYRTIQRWVRLGQVRSRIRAGTLEVDYADFEREHRRAATRRTRRDR